MRDFFITPYSYASQLTIVEPQTELLPACSGKPIESQLDLSYLRFTTG